MGIDVTKEKKLAIQQSLADAYTIDCHACKLSAGMRPAKIKRFTGIVYMAGEFIAIPSAFGMVFSLLFIFFPMGMSDGLYDRLPIAIGFFAFSCTMGTIGWLLISKKYVFLCKRCGFILDRTTE